VGFHEFERSWRKAERWAVLTLQPQRIPPTAQETVWLRSASDLEEVGQLRAARAAYEAGAKRWNSALTQFALANSQYAAGEKAAAEESLRLSVRLDPGFAIGWFNLSQVMAEKGCDLGARQAQACAVQMDPDDDRLRAPLPALEGKRAAQCLPSPPCLPK